MLRLIEAMLKAGSYGKGQLFPSERGTPQGGVVSPTLSNILLTPFDREMRLRGYQLTRYADDWVITCKSAAEARAAVAAASRILEQLGVELHPPKTRIVHAPEWIRGSLATKSNAGRRSSIYPRVRFVVRPDRVRSMRIPRRSRSIVSWTRYGNAPSGRCPCKPRS